MPPNLLAHYLYLWELTAVRQALETALVSASVRRTFIELLVPAGSSSSLGQAVSANDALLHRQHVVVVLMHTDPSKPISDAYSCSRRNICQRSREDHYARPTNVRN